MFKPIDGGLNSSWWSSDNRHNSVNKAVSVSGVEYDVICSVVPCQSTEEVADYGCGRPANLLVLSLMLAQIAVTFTTVGDGTH